MDALVLAVTAENADAILDGRRRFDHRRLPPKRLPARAYLAVSGEGVVGECDLGPRERRTDDGWALPVSRPRRYRTPRDLASFGLTKTPRSFQYVQVNSRASTRSSRG
jgi:predicted transcriptional regulator